MQNSCYRQRDPSTDQCLSVLSELVLLNKRQKISLFPSRKTEDSSNFIFNHFNDMNDLNQLLSQSVDIHSGRDEEATDTFLIADKKETKDSKKSRSSAKQGKYKSSNLCFCISLVCCFAYEERSSKSKGRTTSRIGSFFKDKLGLSRREKK